MKRTMLIVHVVVAGLFMAATAHASFHLMQIEQVIGGVNGDVSAQAIQLRMRGPAEDLVSQARLIARDAAGLNPVLVLDLTTNVPVGITGRRVLIASSSMANYLTVAPDFIMTTPIPASYLAAGTLTWEQDLPATVYWRTSWGGASYTGSGAVSVLNDANSISTPAFAGALPSTSLQALQFRFLATALSVTSANDYLVTAGAATFVNNANISGTVVAALPACSVIYGVDLFTTPPGGTAFQDFGVDPLPAGFFGLGSDAFTGRVTLGGSPINSGSPLGPTDTIVRRDATAALAPGGSATVPIEIVALNLVSAQPITVTYNGGQSPEQWSVRAVLSNTMPQSRGTMQISQNTCDCSEGGVFSSTLPVLPRMIFTRTLPTPATVDLDFPSAGLLDIQFSASGTYLPNDPAFSIVTLNTRVLVDHDADPFTAPVSTVLNTSNFFAGLRMARCDSAGCASLPTPIMRLTEENALAAGHGVLPARPCLSDVDLDGICDEADNCPLLSNPLQIDTDHDGIGDGCDNCPTAKNFCQEDVNHDNIGDVCQLLSVGDGPHGDVMLRRLAPNPVTAALSYAFTIPREMHVTVGVYDVHGRLIDRALDRTLPAGDHSFTWDARRAGVGTGFYVLRLITPVSTQTRKFSFVR